MKSLPITATGQKGFLLYVKENLPHLYNQVKGKLPNGGPLAGMGLVDPASTAPATSVSSTWASAFQNIAQVATQAYLTREQMQAQSKILNLQLTRAQQGLAPLNLDPAIYGMPSAGVTVGMTPDMKRLLMFGGAGVLLVFFLTRR